MVSFSCANFKLRSFPEPTNQTILLFRERASERGPFFADFHQKATAKGESISGVREGRKERMGKEEGEEEEVAVVAES